MRARAWLVLVVAACAPASTTPIGTPLSNDGYGSRGPVADGSYACRIQDGGYDYPPFRCVVSSDGYRTMLEKVEGSVRFRGVIAATPAGGDVFRFDGELYCPWGDCTEPVRAEFHRSGGSYVATFQPADKRRDRMLITLSPIQPGYGGYGYGGYGYGGYGYGGYGYGGYGYGGYGYGGHRGHR